MLVFVKERHPLSWADLCAVAANQYDVKIKWQSSTSRHIDFAPDTQNRKQDVTLFIIPAEHDADPQSIILNRFSFIEGIVSEAIELAGPQDGAEDRMRAFFHAHWEELDSTLDALISMLRRQAIPLGPPDGNSSNSKPTPGATNTSSKDVATLPPDTRVDGIIGRLGSVSTTVETTDDEPEIIPHHGSAENPITSISWITASRLREAERAAGRQMGMQTTATTIDDYEEGDVSLLPEPTVTPLTVSYRRGIPIGSENGNGSDSATEALSHDSSEGTNSSIASRPEPTVTRHVFQLPFVIDGSSAARLQTAGGLTLPRFGSMTFATRTRIERN
ncbi:hypothetical protein MBLNU13_g03862t3 [Cladosporium sp. NU13]